MAVTTAGVADIHLSTFRENTAYQEGGAILVSGESYAVIQNSSFSNNTAQVDRSPRSNPPGGRLSECPMTIIDVMPSS